MVALRLVASSVPAKADVVLLEQTAPVPKNALGVPFGSGAAGVVNAAIRRFAISMQGVGDVATRRCDCGTLHETAVQSHRLVKQTSGSPSGRVCCGFLGRCSGTMSTSKACDRTFGRWELAAGLRNLGFKMAQGDLAVAWLLHMVCAE